MARSDSCRLSTVVCSAEILLFLEGVDWTILSGKMEMPVSGRYIRGSLLFYRGFPSLLAIMWRLLLYKELLIK
jgi:hypothetical protein